MHLPFFKRSFALSLGIPCGLLFVLALLQSGLLQVFSVGIVSQDALVAGTVQSGLLALLMPWVLFLSYQEFWSTRSFSAIEMSQMIWRLYLKYWSGLVLVSLLAYGGLRLFSLSLSGFTPLGILGFAALSFYGALWCVQSLAPDARQLLYLPGVLGLGAVLSYVFSEWGTVIWGVTLGALCVGTWLLWRVFPVSRDTLSGDADVSAFLFQPLFSVMRLPAALRRLAFMASSTYFSLLLFLCVLLPVSLSAWFLLWGGQHWGANVSFLQDYLEPVYPWLWVAILLTQIQSMYFWQNRQEFWLTRPISRWQMQGVSICVHFCLYFMTVMLGVVLCQAYTGYTFQGGFYALVLFFFVLGPAFQFVSLLQLGLGMGNFVGISYLLVQGDLLSYLLWATALAGWVFMITRPHFRLASQFRNGFVIACGVSALLFYGIQQSPVLQAAYPHHTDSWAYRQQSRIEKYLTHVLWLNVPTDQAPFTIAQSVLDLKTQPTEAVASLMQDTLATLNQDRDILSLSPDSFLYLWEGDMQAAAQRLHYWRGFVPKSLQPVSLQGLAFEYALQRKPYRALETAEKAYAQQPSLQNGLQWAYLQRVFLQEEQALRTYRVLQERFPEARAQLLLAQGHLLSWGCHVADALQAYQQVYRQRYKQAPGAGQISLSLADLEQMAQTKKGKVLSCSIQPPTLKDLLATEYIKRSLGRWQQLPVETQFYVASQTLLRSQNNPEVLGYFKPLLQPQAFAKLQAKSQEVSDLLIWAKQHGVMNPDLRRSYSLLPAIFNGKLLTDSEAKAYPHLVGDHAW